ncbi:hypothetical protein, partial [Cellulomonas bogoriensis]|uniref:hypothetical protein n=1 Tax=Cellulomonas bogoriensis TaxID=301388 RepID=UPI001E5EF926
RRGLRGGARRGRSGARRVTRVWRGLSARQAEGVLLLMATVAFVAGMALTAAVMDDSPQDTGRAGAGAPLPGSTALGPVSLVLPADLGPWAPVPEERLVALREGVAGDGPDLDGVWGWVAPDGVLVTVLTAAAGAHSGVDHVEGPFAPDQRIDVPWRGGARHVAGSEVVDGVRVVVLAAELQDGTLAVISVSGPDAALEPGRLREVLGTVRLR